MSQPPAEPAFGGYLDFWGQTGDPGRCLLGGWIGHPWKAQAFGAALDLRIATPAGVVHTAGMGVTFPRADIAAVGVGILLLADAPAVALAGTQWADIAVGDRVCRITAAPSAHALDLAALRDATHPLLRRAAPLDHRQILIACLDAGEPGYTGTDFSPTAATLSVQAAIDCAPAGILLTALLTANEPDLVRLAILRSGRRADIAPQRFAIGPCTGGPSGRPAAALLCLAPLEAADQGECWLEATLACGRVARSLLPPPSRPDAHALRMALAACDDPIDPDTVFDHLAGPAISALHAAIRRTPHRIRDITLGATPQTPSVSLIIPLHHRIDYLEVQLALFSAQPCLRHAEIIYVVDDPPWQHQARLLAQSACARFGLACRMLLPSRNLGFAAASNAGLAAASAPFVCFMNSDVFAGPPDWLDRLIARLRAQPGLGVVGPVLHFPDGSIQHEGMRADPLPARAGWHFPRHTRKGLRPAPDAAGLAPQPAITGACMVLSRALALRLGGFDEAFVIGDFEDFDFCARAATMGLSCAVDHDVALIHLERKSQSAAAPWRAGATLYNAWLSERRWFAAAEPAAKPAPRRRRA